MNKKRDRLSVIFDILLIIRDHNNSLRYTVLLRASRLSSSKFAEYYAELIAKNFITEMIDKSGGKHVSLTDKGFKYLEKYNLILGLINEFEL